MLATLPVILGKAAIPVAASAVSWLAWRFGKKSQLESALRRVSDAVSIAVRLVEQTRRKNMNGPLSSQDRAALKRAAIEKAIELLGPQAKKVAGALGVDVSTFAAYLSDRIEAELQHLKGR